MSDIREVTEWHKVNTDLQRRRELAGMTKPDLIGHILTVENGLTALTHRIDQVNRGEP